MLLNSSKYNILKNSKGFSIVELMIALALLLIALGLGYNLLFFARTSFERSEERWMEQNQVVAISNLVYDSLNEAFYVEIIDSDNIEIDSTFGLRNIFDLSTLEFYGAFYIDGEGETIFEQYDSFTSNNVDPQPLPGEDLTMTFSKVYYTVADAFNDLVLITVESDNLDYKLETQVHIDNMKRGKIIEGANTGDVIVFQTKEQVGVIPETLYDELCFIATAAYESPMDPSVRLLRRFRDNVLLETDAGTKFVEFYYKNSPPIAEVIANSSILRFITRVALYPLVGLVSMMMNPIHLMSVLAGIFITLVIYKKKYGFGLVRRI